MAFVTRAALASAGSAYQQDDSDLGPRIKRAMAASGMRQADLARQLGISPAAVSLWLTADLAKRTTPSDENLRTIAAATSTSLAWLRDGTGVPPPETKGAGLPVTKPRRTRAKGMADALRASLSRSKATERRGNVLAQVHVWNAVERLQDALGANPEATGAYEFFYCDEHAAIELEIIPTSTRSGTMSRARSALHKLSLLARTDQGRCSMRQRYVLALTSPSADSAAEEWERTPVMRVLRTEAQILGVEALFAPNAGTLLDVITGATKEESTA